LRGFGHISIIGLLSATVAMAADKSAYTLFDPTPPALLREMTTDRPDLTESAHTVDAGHWQLESSLLEYTYDEAGDATFTEWNVFPSNLKLGLTNSTDLQLVFEPHVWQRTRSAGHTDSADGFGATQLRFKWNLWGNDEGDTALAVMPFVQFPTARESIGGVDHVEGGLIVPLELSLPQEWSLTTMAEVDLVRDADDAGYGVALVHTASLSHAIAGPFDGYVEYAGVTSRDLGAGYVAVAGGGLAYAVSRDVRLDSGVYFGLSDAADDFRTFVGLSIRM
jgi:hypothetical protein